MPERSFVNRPKSEPWATPATAGSSFDAPSANGADPGRSPKLSANACWSRPSIQASTDCSITHAAASFGAATGPFPPELITSCRALSGDLTGMADPTAGGRLHVEVLSYDANGTQVTTTKQRTQTDISQICMVNGDGRSYLKGSLLALGVTPVPFG